MRRSSRTAADVLRVLRKPAADQPSWLRELLDEWVQQGPDLPSWHDPELIAAGQRFFNNWDLEICTALFTASLPSAYAGRQASEFSPARRSWPIQERSPDALVRPGRCC